VNRHREEKPSVAVLGLGMIGAAVATKLVERGYNIGIYDIRPEAAAAIPGAPAMSKSAAAAARGRNIVLIAVVDGDQARRLLTEERGVLASLTAGATVVLLSTVSINLIEELHALCQGAGVNFVDCGVTVDYKSENPGIVCLAGGDDATMMHVDPVLTAFSKRVLHFGPLGSGMKAKIARNVINYGYWRISHEAGKLAEAAGLDLRKLVEAIRNGDPHGIYGTGWIDKRGTTAPLDPADPEYDFFRHLAILQRKDLAAALALSRELDVDMPCTRIAMDTTDTILGVNATKPTDIPDADRRTLGNAAFEAVYGDIIKLPEGSPDDDPFVRQLVGHLFGEIWSRDRMSVRDRRLMVLGATAALAEYGALEIHLRSAFQKGEIEEADAHDIINFLVSYVGYGRGLGLKGALDRALAAHKGASGTDCE
jgi:3-hydroxyisobutyrate dehydrogenase-like beta-hydroxyacid dehydrogenase/alkylhydroperoxidase/carboxymuconolactone decarboxylase family protein YurZ